MASSQKGRDWYDFVWYVAKNFPLNLAHLEARMKQSGHYNGPLKQKIFLKLLEEKIQKLDIKAAKEDIWRFIKHPKEIDGWSKEFFLNLLPQIKLISVSK